MKFNGFEKYILDEAIKTYVSLIEAEVLEAQNNDRRTIIAPGYYTQVCKDLSHKVNTNTLKKYQNV